jgi:predicted PurR-regulated permease PerM
MSDWAFFRRVLIVGAVLVLGFLVWRLADVMLLLFGAALIGLLLSGAADAFSRHGGLPRSAALAVVILLLVGFFAAIIVLFGTQIGSQLVDLWHRLPGAVENLEQRLNLGDISNWIREKAQSNTGNILFQITSWAGAMFNAVADVLLLVVAACFFAADPGLYRAGALKLVPPEQRPLTEDTLDFSAAALRQWMTGQLIAVLLVGTITTVGLWYIGLPSPLALGLIAGILEFIPFLGPLLAALPALLLAFTMSWTEVAWTVGLFVLVQVLESNLITPLIQKRMVSLPPVLTLFAIVCFGVLFGPLGVLFATPLAVFLFVAVNQLYVRQLLHQPTEVPGEKAVQEERREQAAV